MKHLKIEDIERLSREIGARTKDANEWAEREGLDFELLDQIGNVATNMAHERTVAMVRERFEESGFDSDELEFDEEDQSVGMRMDIGDVIKEACISMFALGFETHKQFGGSGCL